jgi:hypothetical protein
VFNTTILLQVELDPCFFVFATQHTSSNTTNLLQVELDPCFYVLQDNKLLASRVRSSFQCVATQDTSNNTTNLLDPCFYVLHICYGINQQQQEMGCTCMGCMGYTCVQYCKTVTCLDD